MTTEAEAQTLDAADPLRHFRGRFDLPEGVLYLDGNSLGPLPNSTRERLHAVIDGEWGDGLIRSWNRLPDKLGGGGEWITLPQRIGAAIAPLIGAQAHEVIACDSTSVNIFKLIWAALRMQAGDDGRRKVVLSEPGNFPTDLYMIEGLERQGLAERRLAGVDDIEAALDEDVALLMLTHVHYKTGRMLDMARLTAAAQDKGALVLWDLSHSVGAVPVELARAKADFAVGCGYKYLNGGPGAPAFAFVAERHLHALEQPLTGWFGHAKPFDFDDDYVPANGVARLLCGTPQVLGMSALESGVAITAEAGIDALVAKSRALSEFFRACVSRLLPDLPCVSPDDPAGRGSQLSFRHEHAYPICQALIARGVIGDFRAPDILRFGFAPLYIGYEDLLRAAEHLAEVVETGEWDREEFRARAAVT